MAQFRPISEAAFERAQASADHDPRPYAVAARFDRRTSTIHIELSTRATVSFGTNCVRGLGRMPDDDLAKVAVAGGGSIIGFETADVYLSVAPLLEQFFGPMEWGRRERRASASRTNGRRGGRPRKAASRSHKSSENKAAAAPAREDA